MVGSWIAGASMGALAAAAPGGGAGVDYTRDVLPVLSENCFKCHGPDDGARKSSLRLDAREAALAGGKSGDAAIVPGKPEESELYLRITETTEKRRMPPLASGRKLTGAQIETLRRWIEGGAPYRKHWSFDPPRRPSIPAVRRAWWPRNEVDFFVLEKLEERGLEPAPEAVRATLVRRLHLDLTGLPPSLAQVDEFLGDPAPGAYERLVERVLASPHYGEKMAQLWLDLARFGDTSGYHYDSTRQMWIWRDQVIDAFNRNQPFDQFTIEQLAGDLLPGATLKQRIASGFNRNSRFNEEGGADPEEFQVAYTKDRVNTLGQVWLGMTLGCAECHSHKYDPVSLKEYYQLYGFFCSLNEPMVSMNHNQPLPPLVKIPSKEQEAAISQARAGIAQLEERAADALAGFHYEEPAVVTEAAKPVREFLWVDDAIPQGAEHFGDWVFVEPPAATAPAAPSGPGSATPGASPDPGPRSGEDSALLAPDGGAPSGRLVMKRARSGIHQHFFNHAARLLRIDAGDKLFAWVWLDPANPPDSIMLQWNSSGGPDGWHHRAYWGADACWFAGTPDHAEHHRVGELPRPGAWTRLEVDPESVGLPAGSIAYGFAFTQHDGVAYWDAAGIASTKSKEPGDFVWIDDEAPRGANLQGDTPWEWVEAPLPVHSGRRATRRTTNAAAISQHFFTGAADPLPVQAGDRFFSMVWMDPANPPRTIMLQWNDGSWEHRAYWGDDTIGWGVNGTGSRRPMGPLPSAGEWARLEVAARDVDLKPGARLNGWAFTQFGGTVQWDTAGVLTYGPPDDRHLHSQLAWEARERANPASALPGDVLGILKIEPAQRTPNQHKLVRDWYLRHVFAGARAIFDPIERELAELNERIAKTEAEIPYTLVSEELAPAQRRKSYLLERGEWNRRGEEVAADVPAVLPPLPEGAPHDRLTLARWLVAPGNPLVARVTVNRLWAQLFGAGIVRTLGDFGAQGERPSHPELLDWLATELVRSGWDIKGMIRLLVGSATYRQAPRFDAARREKDPGRRLLSSSQRHRLAAEEVRDNALAISGLLSRRIGGPSVMPYQPEGYYLGKLDVWKWEQSRGEDLHRRGLYTFWRRTTLYPTFMIFDAPSRETCCVERPRTNTPLQALALMNDPQFVEAARVFAQRILAEAGEDADARLSHAFRLATARQPSRQELAVLRRVLERELARQAADPEGARALSSFGHAPQPEGLDPVEHAAWTAVANVILSLDETITRE
jgi:mono/diheme cytochrome c family protein